MGLMCGQSLHFFLPEEHLTLFLLNKESAAIRYKLWKENQAVYTKLDCRMFSFGAGRAVQRGGLYWDLQAWCCCFAVRGALSTCKGLK